SQRVRTSDSVRGLSGGRSPPLLEKKTDPDFLQHSRCQAASPRAKRLPLKSQILYYGRLHQPRISPNPAPRRSSDCCFSRPHVQYLSPLLSATSWVIPSFYHPFFLSSS